MGAEITESRKNRGTALIVALVFLSVLSLMTTVFVSNLISSSNFESAFEAKTKSFNIAEAGLNHALWKLARAGDQYDGDTGVPFGEGFFDISVRSHPDAPDKKIVVSRAQLSGYADNRTLQQVRAVVILRDRGEGRFEVSMDSWKRTD
jgi:hypothetical protein